MNMLAGLTSRWTMFFEWAASSASATSVPRSRICSKFTGRPAIKCLSVLPSRYSMAMKSRPFVLGNFVDGANVGVIQGRGRTRFTAETLQGLRILSNIIGQKLEGNEAAKFGVFRLINHAHATTAEFLHNAVVRDGLTDHGSNVSRTAMLGSGNRLVNGVEPDNLH
jgi:hypothetical protein